MTTAARKKSGHGLQKFFALASAGVAAGLLGKVSGAWIKALALPLLPWQETALGYGAVFLSVFALLLFLGRHTATASMKKRHYFMLGMERGLMVVIFLALGFSVLARTDAWQKMAAGPDIFQISPAAGGDDGQGYKLQDRVKLEQLMSKAAADD